MPGGHGERARAAKAAERVGFAPTGGPLVVFRDTRAKVPLAPGRRGFERSAHRIRRRSRGQHSREAPNLVARTAGSGGPEDRSHPRAPHVMHKRQGPR